MSLGISTVLRRMRTPVGRTLQTSITLYHCWWFFRPLGTLYRRLVIRKTRVATVIGSLGKTTTSRTIAAGLGLPEHPSIECNEFSYITLALLRIRPWQRRAVVEVGVGATGQMAAYGRMVRPDVVVATCIGSEHNRQFGTLNQTRAEKAEMVRALPASGLAVLNGDDANVLWMREVTRARVLTYGFAEANDLRASEVSLDWPRGTRFRLHVDNETRDVRLRLIGRAFVYSVLAAVAVGRELGVPLDDILRRVEAVEPTPERLVPESLANGAILLRDEYKSTVESIEVGLDVMEEIPARRKFVVLGDVSERRGSRGPVLRRLGARVAAVATHAVFGCFGARECVVGAVRAGMPRENMLTPGRKPSDIVAALPPDLGEGDVVYVKGRGDQRFARVSLALMGRDVRCDIPSCPAFYKMLCDRCSLLEDPRDIGPRKPPDEADT